jgi:hypothetical protein
MRELMRDYILQQRQARECDEFLQSKVETGRVSMRLAAADQMRTLKPHLPPDVHELRVKLESHLDARSHNATFQDSFSMPPCATLYISCNTWRALP